MQSFSDGVPVNARTLLLALAMALLLPACGGSENEGSELDGNKTTAPPLCNDHPEKCI